MNGGKDDLMTLFYAAVTSVQDGNVGEIEVQPPSRTIRREQ